MTAPTLTDFLLIAPRGIKVTAARAFSDHPDFDPSWRAEVGA